MHEGDAEANEQDSDFDVDETHQPDSDNLRTSCRYDAGDYVVVAFNGKKNRVHYVGLLVEQKTADSDDDESDTPSPVGTVDWKVKFFRRESQSSFKFILPNVEEIAIVNENSFCEKLPPPAGSGTARKRSHIVFPTDLSEYELR